MSTLADSLRRGAEVLDGFLYDPLVKPLEPQWMREAADRIDVLEAALLRIDERMNYPFGPSDFDRIRNIARGALGASS